MYLKNEVVLVWFICLSCKVVTTGCEVVLVNRNVTDSFRVGKDGCTKDTSVCTNYGSSCQSDGQCLCPSFAPNFRRPTQDKSYGCLSNEGVRSGLGGSTHCSFSPFQLIASTWQPNSATAQFSDVDNPNVNFSGCILNRAEAKFPNNATEMKLQWLDESYVDLTIVTNKILHFTWKKSVPGLRGTIITLHLLCSSGIPVFPKCLRAKIHGTWPPDVKPVTTEPTVTSFLPKTTSFVAMTTATTQKQESTSSSTPSSEEKNSQSNTLNVALVAVLAISLLVIVVLGIIVGFLWKKVQRMKGINLKMEEIANIENQSRTNSGNGMHNDGIYEESLPQSGHNNNSNADHKYEEPSNYEPLKRNHLQDESDEHKYQSLTTSQKRK